jgi:hypothetical protein
VDALDQHVGGVGRSSLNLFAFSRSRRRCRTTPDPRGGSHAPSRHFDLESLFSTGSPAGASFGALVPAISIIRKIQRRARDIETVLPRTSPRLCGIAGFVISMPAELPLIQSMLDEIRTAVPTMTRAFTSMARPPSACAA